MSEHANRTRTISWQNPEPDWALARSKSGLELFQHYLSNDGAWAPPISRLMDFKLIEVAFGRVVFEGRPGEIHYNPIGSVHGGYAATLLDSALGCSVHTALPAGSAYTTLELKVNYVKAMTVNTGSVRAEGKVLSIGKRVATAEARLTDAAGALLAHGTTTCLVMPLP